MENRKYLHILFKYVLWFAINELSARGDDEKGIIGIPIKILLLPALELYK